MKPSSPPREHGLSDYIGPLGLYDILARVVVRSSNLIKIARSRWKDFVVESATSSTLLGYHPSHLIPSITSPLPSALALALLSHHDHHHQVRRGNEEGDILDYELLASTEWGDVHALLGQHGQERRHGTLFRPLRHRQNDPVGRS